VSGGGGGGGDFFVDVSVCVGAGKSSVGATHADSTNRHGTRNPRMLAST
jgi:hypothetical protein